MTTKQGLRISPEPGLRRFEVSDGLPAADDGEVRTPVLDGVQQVCEVAGCFGSAHLRHADQIIRYSLANTRIQANRRAAPMSHVWWLHL